jgi:uncharacterized protein (TIGR03086 family)
MSADDLATAIETARAVLAGTSADDLDRQTPCASWKVSDLINHIVGGQAFFAAALRGERPSGDAPDFSAGDFHAAFNQAADACLAGFRAEGVMGQTFELPFGSMPGAAFVGLATTDLFTHAWDLAKATGQSTDLAPELATALLESSRANISDSFRGPDGAPFGPAKEAPSGASAADQLAAFLGRTV